MRGRSRGVAVVVVMLMVGLILSLTAAVGLLTQQNYTNAAFKERMLKAEFAYRAGLATALERLAEDPVWAPTEASPMTVMLTPEEEVGFRLWIDGINRDSTLPVTSTSGLSLTAGQAAVKVVPMIEGVDILSGFGGFEQTPILIQPQVKFEHNLINTDPNEGLHIGGDLTPIQGILLSYNSAGPSVSAPWAGSVGDPVPLAHQKASVRSATDFNLQGVTLWGTAIIPELASFYAYDGGSSLGVQRENTLIDMPRFAVPDPTAPLISLGNGTQTVAPGSYRSFRVDDGAVLTLHRGGTYCFEELGIGQGSELRLDGPLTDGPCVIYSHGFWASQMAKLNVPSPGAMPRPSDLQVYIVPTESCYGTGKPCDSSTVVLDPGTEAAFVEAGLGTIVHLQRGAKLYGSVYGRCGSVIGEGAALHYDEALKDIVPKGKSQWVLVSQGH